MRFLLCFLLLTSLTGLAFSQPKVWDCQHHFVVPCKSNQINLDLYGGVYAGGLDICDFAVACG